MPSVTSAQQLQQRMPEVTCSTKVALGAGAAFLLGCLAGSWYARCRYQQLLAARRLALPPALGIGNGEGTYSPLPSPRTPRTTGDEANGIARDEPANGVDGLRMVLLVRSDLALGKGKVAAQCAHAALGMFKKLYKRRDPNLRAWELSGQTKVCLRAEDEAALVALQATARTLGLPTHSVMAKLAGQEEATRTVMAVLGQGEAINKVTGHLVLL